MYIFFLFYLWLLSSKWSIATSAQALAMGVTWLLLTLAFEFGFGHLFAGYPWSRLIYDYNLLAGRIWVLIPIWAGVAPYVAFKMQG